MKRTPRSLIFVFLWGERGGGGGGGGNHYFSYVCLLQGAGNETGWAID